MTVFTTSGTIDGLDAAGLLPSVLLRFQAELRGRAAVGLRFAAGARSSAGLSAFAMRASALERLSSGLPPEPDTVVDVEGEGGVPMPEPALSTAASLIGTAARYGVQPLAELSHALFFERHHLEGA